MKINFMYFCYCLRQITMLICLTILAIVFNKWWIILFSILISSDFHYSSDNEKEKHKEED